MHSCERVEHTATLETQQPSCGGRSEHPFPGGLSSDADYRNWWASASETLLAWLSSSYVVGDHEWRLF